MQLNGYTYNRKNEYDGKIYWRCANFRSGGCKATAITRPNWSGNEILKEGEHEHPPENDMESDNEELSSAEGTDAEDDEGDGDSVESDSDRTDSDRTASMGTDCEPRNGMEWMLWVEGSDDENSDDASDLADEESLEDAETYPFHELQKSMKRHRRALRNICFESSAIREVVLKEAEEDFICFLCEICLNWRRGYFYYISKYEKNLLRLIEDDIEVMISNEINWERKKEDLVNRHKDHFLSILLNVLYPQIP